MKVNDLSQYKFNRELSEKLSKKYARKIKQRQCYENVYILVSDRIPELIGKKVSVLFCFMPSKRMVGMYFRHAFMVVDGEIIEPLSYIDMDELDKLVPIVEWDFWKYNEALLEDGKFDCWSILFEKEVAVLNESKIILNPIEMSSMVNRVAQTSEMALRLLTAASNGNYREMLDSVGNMKIKDGRGYAG